MFQADFFLSFIFLLAYASFFGGQLLILNTMSYATLYQPIQVHQVVHKRALGFLSLALTKAHLLFYVFL